MVLHGSAQKRLELLDQEADYYIINHDGVGVGAHTRKKFELDGFSKALAEREDIKIAVIDEASAYPYRLCLPSLSCAALPVGRTKCGASAGPAGSR